MQKPTCLKDVQRLTGCVAALSRFISRVGEKVGPLYRLLKKLDKFLWDEETDRAFEELKKTLSKTLVLVAPTDKEPMLLYVAATRELSAQ